MLLFILFCIKYTIYKYDPSKKVSIKAVIGARFCPSPWSHTHHQGSARLGDQRTRTAGTPQSFTTVQVEWRMKRLFSRSLLSAPTANMAQEPCSGRKSYFNDNKHTLSFELIYLFVRSRLC